MKAWKHRSEFQHLHNRKAWLFRVTRNLCIDNQRRSNHRIARAEPIEQDSVSIEILPSAETERQEQADRVRAMLRELPEQHATILYLHYVEELSIHEISKVMDATTSAVKVRLSRARKKLKEWIGKSNIISEEN